MLNRQSVNTSYHVTDCWRRVQRQLHGDQGSPYTNHRHLVVLGLATAAVKAASVFSEMTLNLNLLFQWCTYRK